MKYRSGAGALSLALASVLGLAVSAVPAAGQTTATLQAFSIERAIALNNILTTIIPTADPSVLAAIAGGALEMRERLIYNPQANTVTSTVFLVASGSPIPTPLTVDLTHSTVAAFTLGINSVTIASKPVPSILFAGNISFSTMTPYGIYTGAPAAISVGYTNDTPPKINNVVDVISGAVVTYSASAAGTITVMQASTSGGGGGGTSNAPVVVLNPATQTAITRLIRLDASMSTDPKNLPLTFAWTAPPSPSANIINANTATPDVQLLSGFGTYTFQVTVTDSAGLSSTATATVNYVGR